MNIDIVIVYVPRYEHGHERNFVPPLTGIHLAALTPPRHRVRVIHQQVEPPDLDTDADVVMLSFFSGFAPEAYRLAMQFRGRGRTVVGGGPHVTFHPAEALHFFHAVVTGEAEPVWEQLLNDIEGGNLRQRYAGSACSMRDLPTPRYDLLPSSFFIPRVVQATRGCPFSCSFCTVPTLNPGFRTRPVSDVLRDIGYNRFKHWWQRKIVWFWDDNLTIQRDYIRRLLAAMTPLRKWWLTQASMDVARDAGLLDLMRASGCIGIFFGIETFGAESLRDAHKLQNKAGEYADRIRALHARGICVMGGFIAGFDGDTPQSIRAMARHLYDIGVDVPFLSVLTPFRGTAAYARYRAEGRLSSEKGWEFFNGYNVAFTPAKMSADELLDAHRALWREAFSFKYAFKRTLRALFTLRPGAFLMCACMNAFYCLKALRGNTPRSFESDNPYRAFSRRLLAGMHAPAGPTAEDTRQGAPDRRGLHELPTFVPQRREPAHASLEPAEVLAR